MSAFSELPLNGTNGAFSSAALRQAWQNEKNSPEILNYEGYLVHEVTEQLQRREDQLMAGATSVQEQFTANLLKMEMERVRYILKSYLRIRLAKIERFYPHLIANEGDMDRLSEEEKQFCITFGNAVVAHFHNAFLRHVPELISQPFSSEDRSVPTPDLDKHVMCRVLEDIEAYEIDRDEEPLRMVAGDIFVFRYRAIRPLLLEKRIELI
jgi:GINS complex subunit 4